MFGKIVFNLIAFLLFAYLFIFKLIKKNDTTYLVIIISQAIGILLNFIQILFDILNGFFFDCITYMLCIIVPAIVLLLEFKGLNSSELVSIFASKMYRVLGNRKKAKDILMNLVSKYDKSYYGHKMLAEIYQEEGGMRKAIDEYVKVLDIKPDDYKSYFKISKLLIDLGKKDEAIEMLTILSKKKPELYEATGMLGDLLIEKENFKEAINTYIKAIKYKPENSEFYYNLGIAYSRINDFSLAKECFLKTVELDNNSYNAYYRLGQIALLYRDINEAEQFFLQSIYGETEIKSFYQLAKIYMMKNDKVRATMFLNKATEISYEFYQKASEEPMFFSIKDQIIKSESEKEYVESDKERNISEYLDNTYVLTKVLDEKKKTNNTKRKF